MKNILLILLIVFLFTSCNDTDQDKEYNNNIVGTWELNRTALQFEDNGEAIWSPVVENAYQLSFSVDLSHESTYAVVCNNTIDKGTYLIYQGENSEILEVTITCDVTNEVSVLNYFLSFQQGKMYLGPGCDEGCIYEYVRVEN
jgi:hypothetical protein